MLNGKKPLKGTRLYDKQIRSLKHFYRETKVNSEGLELEELDF